MVQLLCKRAYTVLVEYRYANAYLNQRKASWQNVSNSFKSDVAFLNRRIRAFKFVNRKAVLVGLYAGLTPLSAVVLGVALVKLWQKTLTRQQ